MAETNEDFIKYNYTRAWPMGEFRDYYNVPCSIQKSSIADADTIWLGTEDAAPQIMAKDAAAHGIETTETTGWVPYPIPDAVLLTTRMLLTQEQVIQLLPALTYFAATGELPVPDDVDPTEWLNTPPAAPGEVETDG